MNDQKSIFESKPRVLIVDNNERIVNMYKELITLWGFSPVIAQGIGNSLLEDAKRKVMEFRCQIALVDLRLVDDLDEEDVSGLKLVPEIKPAVSLIVSASNDVAKIRQSDDIGAARYVGKGEGPGVLKKELKEVVSSVCAFGKDLAIEPYDVIDQVSKTLFKGDNIKFSDQLVDILCRLFPDVNGLRIEKLGKDHESSDISTVPRPRSVILRVYEKVGEDERQPVLVKIARTEKINEDVSRYEAHIRRQLVGHYTANLEGSTCAWDIGGAIYSYFGDAEIIPFSQYFQNEGAEKINQCLKHFFSTTWSAHYKRAKTVTDLTLLGHYHKVWGAEWYERAITFRDLDVSSIMGPERWEAIQAPHPIKWLENLGAKDETTPSKSKPTLIAVTHGDLHGDNILVDENNIAWVIDFERTGEGHALQDFVELESDIINRLKWTNENISDFYKLCIVITKQTEVQALDEGEIISTDGEIEKALQVISMVRSLAREATGISNFQEYLFGLLFNTIFRATITPDDPLSEHQKRALMLASIICHRLDHWNEPWPPNTWTLF